MKTIITNNYEEMSKVAMQHLLGHMFYKANRVNMAITAGTTPIKMYEMLIPEVKDRDYLQHVHYYNFDEIPHKVKKEEGITMSDLRRLFFTPAGVSEKQIHALSEYNYIEQDKRLMEDGGLDVILLGIGADGHYCGNLPGTTMFKDHTIRVECGEEMRKRISGHFESMEDTPDYYVTMGPASVMNARHLILFATGLKKADIMKKWYECDIDVSLPASILKMHPNLTVIMDKEAASLL